MRFVLIDVIKKVPRLIIDNHEPFGFHVHEDLPNRSRRILEAIEFEQALDEFWKLSKIIIDCEL